MAGNPFRKQVPQDEPEEAPRPKSKTKKVKFVSPVASPQEPPSHPRFPTLEELDDGLKSPPPKGLRDVPDAVDTRALLRGDVTAGGTVDLKANAQEEAATAGRLSASQLSPDFQLSQPPAGKRAPPANPFARTLATMDAEATSGKFNSNGGAKSKAAMDVDAFTRMLMGSKANAPPVGNSEAEEAPHQNVQDGLQRTETEPRADSPDSMASLEDASTDDDSTGGEVDTMTTTASVPTSPARPGPQTVSFDDFDDEGLQPANEAGQSQTHSAAGIAPSQTKAAVSPKPLPASLHGVNATNDSKKSSLPPPPPSSRRQRPGGRDRSDSNTSDVAQRTPSLSDAATPGRPKAPPPRAPAPRMTSRDVQAAVVSPDSTRTPSVEASPAETPSEMDGAGGHKARPPPPPSRGAARPPAPSARRLSSSSSNIVLPQRPSPAGGGAAPPPPPPRRGGDTQRPGSIAESRSSSISLRRDSTSSVEPSQRVVEAQSDTGAKAPVDMLADLDAFQREVDALRARALRGK